MLTIEMLKQNANLAGLTDAQINAIAEMSKNDESAVIGTRIGTLHGQYDTDIFNITGIKKNDGEKSYDYAKRVLSEYKTKAQSSTELETKLNAANKKVTDLEAKIAEGSGDDTLKQQLKDTKAQVTQLQAQLNTEKETFGKEKMALEEKVKNVHIDYAFSAAFSGLKFKDGTPDSVKNVLLQAAKQEVLAKGKPDFIEENGEKKLVFRDENGNILNNVKNNMNPFTVKELVLETALKDVIASEQQKTGGGTSGSGSGASGGNSSKNTLFDLSSCKTQVEATKVIEQGLMADGLTRDSSEFQTRLSEAYIENNVKDLPIR